MTVDTVKARSLFTSAVEDHAPEQWDKFLDDACGGDVALRQRVDLLLRAHQGEDSFLDRGDVDETGATTDHRPITEQPGTVIGPYKLLQQIGEGGMGVVFMAEQTEPIQRIVALKIIKPGMDTRQVIARFEAERQAVAMMDHPNIAKVLDAGTTDSGRPYFVMELVKGVPITKYCDEKQLTLRERLELLKPVCEAVQHAHQKGIIHRDIKPTNVLVAEYDNHAVPKVIDFGVAKATAQKLTERTMFTEFGQVIGTVEYMSPEQAKFNQLDIDTRSDIYSLGVLLYELLTGSTPFEQKRLREAAFDEVLRIIREEEPPKPSTRLSTSETLPSIAANRHTEPTRLSRDVSGELDWIVMKCLEKDRNRRYETANGLLRDMERYLTDEPVQACPPSAAYRFRKLARRHKVALLTSVMFIAVLVLGAAASAWQAIRATRAEATAKQQRQVAEEAALVADEQKQLAQRQRDLTLTNLYVASIPLAYEDWKHGNLNRMWDTLAAFLPQQGLSDLRGWEWFYLVSLLEKDKNILHPDLGPIRAVKWSSDGRLLAVASQQGVKLYDAMSKRLVRSLAASSPIAWRPDTLQLATITKEGSSTPREVTIWDVETGQPLRRIEGGVGLTYALAWRPDGRALAWCGDTAWRGDHSFDIWKEGDERAESHVYKPSRITSVIGVKDEKTEKPQRDKNDAMAVEALAGLQWMSDNRQLLIETQYNARIVVWNDDRKVISEQIPVRGAWGFTAIERSPVDARFALSANSGRVFLWDAEDRKSFMEIGSSRGRVHGIAWSPDGKRLASGGDDNLLRVWDASSGKQVQQFAGQHGAVYAVDWSPSGEFIASGGLDGSVWIGQANRNQDALALSDHAANTLAWSPDGAEAAARCPDGIRIFNTESGEQLRQLEEVPFGILIVLAWSPNGKYIGGAFLVTGGNAACIWDAHSGTIVEKIPQVHELGPRCISWSPDSQLFATSGGDGVKIWDTTTRKLLRHLRGHDATVGSARWSPNARWFASADWDHHVMIWDTVTWTLVCELRNERPPDPGLQADGTYTIAWSPDSRRLVTRSGRGDIVVWELEPDHQPRRIWTARAHTTGIRSLAWSPDGQRIASASEDRLVKLWDAANGREIVSFDNHDRIVMTVAWSPDGTRLASAPSEGDNVLIRDARPALNVNWRERGLGRPPLNQNTQPAE